MGVKWDNCACCLKHCLSAHGHGYHHCIWSLSSWHCSGHRSARTTYWWLEWAIAAFPSFYWSLLPSIACDTCSGAPYPGLLSLGATPVTRTLLSWDPLLRVLLLAWYESCLCAEGGRCEDGQWPSGDGVFPWLSHPEVASLIELYRPGWLSMEKGYFGIRYPLLLQIVLHNELLSQS